MMATIYELPREKEMFVDKVREIIVEHNYKDVIEKSLWILRQFQ